MKRIFLVMTIAAILAVSLASIGMVSAVLCTVPGCESSASPRNIVPYFNPASDFCYWSTSNYQTYDVCSVVDYGAAAPWAFKGPEPYICQSCNADGTNCASIYTSSWAPVCSACDCTAYLSGFGGGYGGAVCGNNAVESPEVCDDGNTVTEYCGDSVVQPGAICTYDCSAQNYLNEACDAGANNGVSCTPVYGGSCTYCSNACGSVNVQGAYCGDGTVNVPNEQCEGATPQACTINGYAGVKTCNNCQFSACTPTEYCGDGIVNDGESCDAAAGNGVPCTPAYGSSCTYCAAGCSSVDVYGAYCGDGNVDAGYEQCEGAATASCTINGYAGEKTCNNCQFGACVPQESCGDGVKNGLEACDTGANNGETCTPDYGSSCTYCSSGCGLVTVDGPYCGDGNVNTPYEQCEGSSTQNCDISGYAGMQTCNAQCSWGACGSTQVSGDKIDALTTLKTLPGNGADPLKKAIELLTKSMKAIYWIDPTHVLCKTSPGGDSLVFDKERDAVYQLMKITTRDSRYAAVRNVIFEIVAVDRNLAVTLINEAPAGSEKTTALKELALGDSYASKGKYKDAVEHYKKAWQHAEKVAPSCVGLHTILTGDVIGEETSGQGLFCRLFGWC